MTISSNGFCSILVFGVQITSVKIKKYPKHC
jgi:hypothetical protein